MHTEANKIGWGLSGCVDESSFRKKSENSCIPILKVYHFWRHIYKATLRSQCLFLLVKPKFTYTFILEMWKIDRNILFEYSSIFKPCTVRKLKSKQSFQNISPLSWIGWHQGIYSIRNLTAESWALLSGNYCCIARNAYHWGKLALFYRTPFAPPTTALYL